MKYYKILEEEYNILKKFNIFSQKVKTLREDNMEYNPNSNNYV